MIICSQIKINSTLPIVLIFKPKYYMKTIKLLTIYEEAMSVILPETNTIKTLRVDISKHIYTQTRLNINRSL